MHTVATLNIHTHANMCFMCFNTYTMTNTITPHNCYTMFHITIPQYTNTTLCYYSIHDSLSHTHTYTTHDHIFILIHDHTIMMHMTILLYRIWATHSNTYFNMMSIHPTNHTYTLCTPTHTHTHAVTIQTHMHQSLVQHKHNHTLCTVHNTYKIPTQSTPHTLLKHTTCLCLIITMFDLHNHALSNMGTHQHNTPHNLCAYKH